MMITGEIQRKKVENVREAETQAKFLLGYSVKFLAGSSKKREGWYRSLFNSEWYSRIEQYVDSSDEEENFSERENDLETEEPCDDSDHDNEVETDWIHIDMWFNMNFF